MFRFLTRRVFDVFRGLDQLIWALVFVRAMGLGPIAGILAIFVSDTGVLAKLYPEAIENAARGQVDGIRSTGCRELMTLRLGVLPQVLPVMLCQALYQLESNSREATILGLVGAGGIARLRGFAARKRYFLRRARDTSLIFHADILPQQLKTAVVKT